MRLSTANLTIRQQNNQITQQNRDLEQANQDLVVSRTEAETQRDQAKAVTDFLVESFRKPDPAEDGRLVKVADLLDRSGEEARQGVHLVPGNQGVLLNAVGETYNGLGVPTKLWQFIQRPGLSVRPCALAPTTPTRWIVETTSQPPTSRLVHRRGHRTSRNHAQADGSEARPRPPPHAHQPQQPRRDIPRRRPHLRGHRSQRGNAQAKTS